MRLRPYGDSDIGEVERARESVDVGYAHHEDGRGEHGCQYILDGRLTRFVAVLVESHHCGQRQRSRFQTDHEHQEVTGRNHEIHAEQSHQQQLVELAATDSHHILVGPAESLYHDYEHTHIEDVLDIDHRPCSLIHAGEGHSFTCDTGDKAEHRESGEEYAADYADRTLLAARQEGVGEEDDQKYG